MYLICDNHDTLVGMRLGGVEGAIVDNEESAKSILKEISNEEKYGVILMTEKVINMIKDTVYDIKLNKKTPLIIEIPDRHGNGRTKDSITKYVEEAIGVKLQ